MKVGVIGLQGSVQEHYESLSEIVKEKNVYRIKKKGMVPKMDKLVIPGGESTTLSRLLETTGISSEVKDFSKKQKPILGTCAGLIVLAKEGSGKIRKTEQNLLGLIDIKVNRNAFGRQKESFEAPIDLDFLEKPFPSVFIRAPAIIDWGEDVDILGKHKNKGVAAKQNNVLVTAFHPELVDDKRVFNYFLGIN